MSDTKVKVAVRVRPMNRRETELHTKCVVDMEDNQTVLHPPVCVCVCVCVCVLILLCPVPQVFAFDHCFWSMDESNMPKYAGKSQTTGSGLAELSLPKWHPTPYIVTPIGPGQKKCTVLGIGCHLGCNH
uniref:Kinesin motor domain-containing protein n=1 Tax=Oncorhynchus kisutch TaxID=8019 RepID=A0A8C7ILE6_ONCKI